MVCRRSADRSVRHSREAHITIAVLRSTVVAAAVEEHRLMASSVFGMDRRLSPSGKLPVVGLLDVQAESRCGARNAAAVEGMLVA